MLTILDIFKAVYGFFSKMVKIVADMLGKEVNLPDLSGLGDDIKDMITPSSEEATEAE